MKITNENFAQLQAADKPLLIDFWATWCGPCRKIAPDIEELSEQYADRVNIGKCNVEEAEDIAAIFGIRSIPTLIFIKNGEVVNKMVGAYPKSVIEEKIKTFLL